ncbi:MAG: hypothetical protein MI747_20165 [Desulfobacterales bacterium]|nr:hypothetical protein [Desulfobacterales bacterium]
MKKLVYMGTLFIASLFFAMTVQAADLSGKKVLFIDSYHQGYGWSDGITQGVKSAIGPTGAELKTIQLDTKRNTDEAFKKEAALKAKGIIESFKPDVVIAADDNASKFLIMPYFKDAATPFVFCGVNWDVSGYGYPYANVTGMIEVTPVPQLIEQLAPFAQGDKIGFLGPDTITAHKESSNWDKTFGIKAVTYFAKDFEDWKAGFQKLQAETDILIIDSDGGLYSDNKADMKAFVEQNAKKPIGTTYDFMAPYALITFAKVAQEQGFWAGETAAKILSGTAPGQIPMVKNKEGKLIINMKIAAALGIEIPYELAENAESVIE